jgi:5-methylcytosine-specific restriction endonuclease McrA
MKNKIIKICQYCKKEYLPGRRNSNFCGITCFNKSKSGIIHPISEETKEKIRQTLKRKGLIPKSAWKKGHIPWIKGKNAFWNKDIKKNLPKGVNHWNWKGGVTSIQEKLRKSLEYKNWRRLVFTRDNFTCQYCGQIGGELNAHHIKPWKDYPELRYEIDNGITLCKFCHKELHKSLRIKKSKNVRQF